MPLSEQRNQEGRKQVQNMGRTPFGGIRTTASYIFVQPTDSPCMVHEKQLATALQFFLTRHSLSLRHIPLYIKKKSENRVTNMACQLSI